MDKKLPSVYAGEINKKFNNNDRYYYSSPKDVVENKTTKPSKDVNIYKKINDIFNSSSYVYKADVDILYRNGKSTKRVIGRDTNNLITIDNELIPISEIIDIDMHKKNG